jgi:WS/DGAT/MGAT family acyltransferase
MQTPHRLNGLEAFFLFHENETQNANTGCMLRLRLDDLERPITLDALRAHVGARLDLAPVLRMRLYNVPFRLQHPIFVDDPDFELDSHLGELTLQSPADLHRQWAMVTQQKFNRTRPMWRMVLVHVGDGSQAIFYIFHHVLMDGVGYIGTLNALWQDDPVPASFARPLAPERWSRGRLLKDGLRDLAKLWAGFPRLVRDTQRGRKAMAARIAETQHEVPPPSPTRLPLSPGYAPSIDRRMATVDLPFDQVRAVRQASGATINTVLLAVVSISLRRYLLRRNSLPSDSLIAGVMASLEPLDAAPRPHGNLFANFLVPVATDLDDPWAQMNFIGQATAEGKLRLERLGMDMATRWFDMFTPMIGIPITKWQEKRFDPQKMRASFTFSNVRGASEYHFLGAQVAGIYTYGPIGDPVGIFTSVTNLGDSFNMVVNANPSALEDPDELAESFKDTLAELVTLAAQHADNVG